MLPLWQGRFLTVGRVFHPSMLKSVQQNCEVWAGKYTLPFLPNSKSNRAVGSVSGAWHRRKRSLPTT